MRNYLTIAGVDSRDYGVYISGQGTFNAPARAYEFYDIPGRSGALIGNEKRLENIEVSYDAFIYNNFSENIANFRSFLLSLVGYQRLEDSYHPDEYRMACYVGPFGVDVEPSNNVGEFTITFNCKPQRYLKSGETTYYYGQAGTVVSGSTVDVYGAVVDPSYVKATVSRAFQGQYVYFTGFEIYADDVKVYTASWPGYSGYHPSRVEVDCITGIATFKRMIVPLSGATWTKTSTTYNGKSYNLFRCSRNVIPSDIRTGAMIVDAVKYSPCSYYPATPQRVVQDAVQYGRNIIGDDGTYIYIYDKTYASDTAANFGTMITNSNVAMDLTITTYTLTLSPYTPNLPSTWVRVQIVPITRPQSADPSKTSRSISFQYTETEDMENPSIFPSKPLIRAYGTGAFNVNNITITITTSSSYTDIDCDLMDCYEEGTNRNNDVSFSTYDFPELQPGNNTVTIDTQGNITAVEITPRWWRL